MKFKFINFSYEVDLLMVEDNSWEIVPCPLPYSNLPDGEYLIRGPAKEHRKCYWKVEDVWFLTENITKDNGHHMCDAARYLLFPQQSESFWKNLKAVPWKCLSKYWQRALWGYEFSMQLRETGRNVMRSMMEFEKEWEETVETTIDPFIETLNNLKDAANKRTEIPD